MAGSKPKTKKKTGSARRQHGTVSQREGKRAVASKPGKNGNSGRPPVSKESSPCFSLCCLLLEKLSKSLIPLSDCPFLLNRLPVILGKSPCFRFETGNFRRCKSASRRLLVCCACGDRGARQMAGSPGNFWSSLAQGHSAFTRIAPIPVTERSCQ